MTRDSARGLIVSMSDVLFDTGKYSLKPGAREKLAKVAGILLAYPGLNIEVDGGFALGGNLNTDIALSVSEGPTGVPSAVEATLGTSIQSAAFLSGSVSLVVIRGGLEGQLDVADGAVQTKADLYFGKIPPTFTATGHLGILAGQVSAFADYWGLFSGWKHFWSATLFKWGGYCFNFNNGVKFANGACAAL